MDLQTLYKETYQPLLVFSSPQQAVASEEYLRSKKILFVPVPTPRELANGCGISIRLWDRDLIQAIETLNQQNNLSFICYRWEEERQKWSVLSYS